MTAEEITREAQSLYDVLDFCPAEEEVKEIEAVLRRVIRTTYTEATQPLVELLEEADGLLVQHHNARLVTFRGDCPVCTESGEYPNNIFGRIAAACLAVRRLISSSHGETEGEGQR